MLKIQENCCQLRLFVFPCETQFRGGLSGNLVNLRKFIVYGGHFWSTRNPFVDCQPHREASEETTSGEFGGYNHNNLAALAIPDT